MQARIYIIFNIFADIGKNITFYIYKISTKNS